METFSATDLLPGKYTSHLNQRWLWVLLFEHVYTFYKIPNITIKMGSVYSVSHSRFSGLARTAGSGLSCGDLIKTYQKRLLNFRHSRVANALEMTLLMREKPQV